MKNRHTVKYREIGRRIAFYRNLKGWSQEYLTEKANISRSYLSKIEAANSNFRFSLEVLLDIADALELDVSAFFLPVDETKIRK